MRGVMGAGTWDLQPRLLVGNTQSAVVAPASSPDLLRAFKRDLVKREDGSVRRQRARMAKLKGSSN